MTDIANHENYNAIVETDNGQIARVYANWLHNQGLDKWQGWHCQAGSTRLLIDKDLMIYSGECRNDILGHALQEYKLLNGTLCRRQTCTGCTDDLIVSKHAPVYD